MYFVCVNKAASRAKTSILDTAHQANQYVGDTLKTPEPTFMESAKAKLHSAKETTKEFFTGSPKST